MKISLSPSVNGPIEDLAALAPLAEEHGYYGLWRAEGVAWDAFSVCALWAQRTRNLQVATGIVSAVTRHPGALARAAVTLQEISNGRFRLGLGIGNNPEVPQPRSPLGEMERVALAVQQHWRDGLVPDVTQPAPPIWFAALRPKMVALSARVAAGVVLNWVTPEYVRQVRQIVGPGFPIACFVRSIDATRTEALVELRRNLVFYRGLEVYRKALEFQGLDPDRMSDEEMLRLVIRGTADHAAWQEAGVDELVLRPIGSNLAGTISRLGPSR